MNDTPEVKGHWNPEVRRWAENLAISCLFVAVVGVSALIAWLIVALLHRAVFSSFIADQLLRIQKNATWAWTLPETDLSAKVLVSGLCVGAAAFGTVVLVATLKELANVIPALLEFMRERKAAILARPVASVFAAFLGLSMSLFALGSLSDERTLIRLTFPRVAGASTEKRPPRAVVHAWTSMATLHHRKSLRRTLGRSGALLRRSSAEREVLQVKRQMLVMRSSFG